MEIDVIDMDDEKLGEHRLRAVKQAFPSSVIVTMNGMCNGVEQMITKIIAISSRLNRTTIPNDASLAHGYPFLSSSSGNSTIDKPVKIDVIRIWGHGYPGGQIVSSGKSARVARDHYAGISIHNIDQAKTSFSKLRPYLHPNSFLELRGCSVGDGKHGLTLMRALSDAAGLSVRAGMVSQYGAEWDNPIAEYSTSCGYVPNIRAAR